MNDSRKFFSRLGNSVVYPLDGKSSLSLVEGVLTGNENFRILTIPEKLKEQVLKMGKKWDEEYGIHLEDGDDCILSPNEARKVLEDLNLQTFDYTDSIFFTEFKKMLFVSCETWVNLSIVL